MGNFRVQIIDESGHFLRQLSFLSTSEQVIYQRDSLYRIQASRLREFAAINLPLPCLAGPSMANDYALAAVRHPSNAQYARIMALNAEWRAHRSQCHHPFALAYASPEKDLVVIDRENSKVFGYNADGSRANWMQLSQAETSAVSSVFSCLKLLVPVKSSKQPNEATDISYVERIFISDPVSHRIAVFDFKSCSFLSYIGASSYGDQLKCSNGFLPGELHSPHALSYFTHAGPEHDPSVSLIVCDSGNHSISIFDASTGEFRNRIGKGFGHLEGYFDSPSSIDVLENRQLFVCDQRNHRIQVFDLQNGNFIRAFGRLGTEAGQFSFPSGIAVCAALPDAPNCYFGGHRKAKVVVSDTANNRLQILTLEGKWQMTIDVSMTPFPEPLEPMGICTHPRSGYFLVAEPANKSIVVFKNDGNYVTCFGGNMEPENQFQRPVSVVITPMSSFEGPAQVLVVDTIRCDVCTFDVYGGT